VNEESCIGTRYFKDLMPEDFSDLESALKALVDRYMKIDCSCFTPNDERVEQVLKEYRDSKAEGIIYYSLAFCHTYNIEAYKIQKACEKEGIPFLFIETDYSPEDIGQIQTRIEAFFETIRERRR
jgi:benzoyl-CoA reductase/2-hydroxyglutaryl-CoA dehydratase subunit BcrC/BadD/HgdB